MLHPHIRRELALRYHDALPTDVRAYLIARGIPDEVVDRNLLGWTGRRIAIPIFSLDGAVLSFRYAKSPHDHTDSPKVLSELGADAELYGWETLAKAPYRVVICEGEFDRLVLEARGFPAVTSTAGANTFLRAWTSYFAPVRHVFICFDRDEAGEIGARKVRSILPQAHIVTLPDEVGEHGDITDYFVRCRKDRADFEILLATAVADEELSSPEKPPPRPKPVARRAERLKKLVSLESVVKLTTDLRGSGSHLVGRCPFHSEQVPSLVVYRNTNTYYCFGCGAHGDAISFLMRKESKTFGQALEALENILHDHGADQ